MRKKKSYKCLQFFGLSENMELSLTELRKTLGEASLGQKALRSLVLDRLKPRCLSESQADLLSGDLSKWV